MRGERADGARRALDDAVSLAADVTARTDLDDQLRPVAFQVILEHLLDERPEPASPVPNTDSEVEVGSAEEAEEGRDGVDVLGVIGRRLEASRDVLGFVYRVDGDAVTVVVPFHHLGANGTEATRRLAVLVCAARQSGLGESEVEVTRVREACDAYGVLDSANFMATLRAAKKLVAVRGAKHSKTSSLKLRMDGWNLARSIVAAVESEESGRS